MTLILLLAGLILLLLTGLPIFVVLMLFAGALELVNGGALSTFPALIVGEFAQYLLVAIPLFAFMAHVMIRSRIVDDLYDTAFVLTRHLPGGVGIATVAACVVFAAISGSSVATALTIGAVAIPQMLKFGYTPRAAYGLVAAGGTLGILIPPSGPLLLYGVTADASIGQLFMAGVLPGLLIAALFVAWTVGASGLRSTQPRLPRAGLAEAAGAVRRSFWALSLPVFVLGGMYAGIFTATEAAGTGAILALLIGILIYRSIGLREIWASVQDACRTSAMLFMILAGAAMLNQVLTKMRLPQEILQLVAGADLGAIGFILCVMALIFVLGMFLEAISIILITTPVVAPVLHQLGVNPVWYGILLVINLELAMITPPVGLNLFTIKSITRAPLGEIIMGTLPYIAILMIGLGILLAWPDIALWLPATMMGR
ncbi:TRAP transporter large permease [Tistrella mobilis]|uniref:TRAP transporter large permease protein n=1 Tax=Tistrella mobilis (strain KA081020-065) TaxID=1110502 RepID=I3TW35_TISMK|nr:TRAP transporter large permease [Tistrella mobilis]AFK56973.1 C4-dicarboxylate TRAP-T family tripartite ATP-independent periplasmic transporter, membrane protein, large subunit [Tistrella mobilis KA081020-065]